MAEVPSPSNGYLHRSIDQIRSMNERGVLSSLSHLTSTDLRTAQLVHDYKPFNLNEFRHNVERLDYSLKNGLTNAGLERSVNLPQQTLIEQHDHQQQVHNQLQQQQLHQTQQQQTLKQTYSESNSPMSETLEQKYDPNSSNDNHQKKQGNTNQSTSTEGRETKPYKCTNCTKTFANSSYLSQHARIHLGIKPYRCEVCQRKFTQLSHLQQHIRTHTGDKPYKCRHSGCPKAFSQLSNLQSHSRCHQTDKPFKCNSCYKCFTDELTLMEHIPKHKESKHLKTHICNLCGKSYTQETYLTKHVQKHAEKSDKQQQQRTTSNNSVQNVPSSGIGLNLQRQVVMNAAAAVIGETNVSYWTKVGADNAVNAASLAEAIQQQQQSHQQQLTQNNYNFGTLQQQQQQELLHHHHRLVNGGGSDSAGSGSTPIQSQSPNDVGEDLVVRQSTQTHLQQSSNSIIGNNYDVKTSSAFTPINAAPPHLNALNQQRSTSAAYLYQQNTAAPFPTQLISLHQIRNYAHNPGSTTGLLAGEHLLGLSVTAGGGKDKGQ